MKTAFRAVSGIVVEVATYPENAKLSDCFHADLGFVPQPVDQFGKPVPVAVGMTWDGHALLPAPALPPPAPPVPDVISDRQCFQQLAAMGKISQDEAIAAVTVGALPKAVSDGIAALPAEQQFPARMLLCGATEFHRLHPMALVFLAFFGLGEPDRDPLWTAAAAL